MQSQFGSGSNGWMNGAGSAASSSRAPNGGAASMNGPTSSKPGDAPLVARGGNPPASLGIGKGRAHERPQSTVYGPSTSLGFGFKTSFDSSYSRSNTLPNALGISPQTNGHAAGSNGNTSEFGARIGMTRSNTDEGLTSSAGRGTPGDSPGSTSRGNAVRSADGRVLFLSKPSTGGATRLSSSATGFMVPISGTGARQKVSIVNAGQRKKAAMAMATGTDFARWPQENPLTSSQKDEPDAGAKDPANGKINGGAPRKAGMTGPRPLSQAPPTRAYSVPAPKGQSLRAYNAAKEKAEAASRAAAAAAGLSQPGPSDSGSGSQLHDGRPAQDGMNNSMSLDQVTSLSSIDHAGFASHQRNDSDSRAVQGRDGRETPNDGRAPISVATLKANKARRDTENSATAAGAYTTSPLDSPSARPAPDASFVPSMYDDAPDQSPPSFTSIKHIRTASGRQGQIAVPLRSSSEGMAQPAGLQKQDVGEGAGYRSLSVDPPPSLDFSLPNTSLFSTSPAGGTNGREKLDTNMSSREPMEKSPEDDLAPMFKGMGSLRASHLPPYEPSEEPTATSYSASGYPNEKEASKARDNEKSLPPTPPVSAADVKKRLAAPDYQDSQSTGHYSSATSSLGGHSRGETTPSPLPGAPGIHTDGKSEDSSHEGSFPRSDTPSKKPPKPTRNPDRRPGTAPTPDPATLARLESNAASASMARPGTALGTTAADSASASQTAAAASAAAAKKDGVDPKTYIPPGALTRTRKRTPTVKRTDASSRFGAGANYGMSRFSESTTGGSAPAERQEFGLVETSRFAIDDDIVADEDDEIDEDDTRAIEGYALPASAWNEVEDALLKFKDAAAASPGSAGQTPASNLDKGGVLRTVLLPFLQLESERPYVVSDVDTSYTDGRNRRALFFEWIGRLLMELQHVQTSADRGAILESIAFILESCNLSPKKLRKDPDDAERFNTVFGHILTYAIGELNKKGVYQNTLIFSGRLLAIAFFRIQGVASKLLRALPVNRFALERVAAEAGWEDFTSSNFQKYTNLFPEHLRLHCFQDARSYLHMLDTLGSEKNSDEDDGYLVRSADVEVEMSGNWLRRWQSDDSELFFSFCRNYHRQLATFMNQTRYRHLFFGAPGYAHLATCIHQKCVSLVHREILSVTTLSSQKNFNPGETANVLSGSTAGKPRHLEAANRRCTAIVVDVVRAPGVDNPVFTPMIQLHIKCLIKRTSLYDVQGVFCLLDWMDSVFTQAEVAELRVEDVMDISFVIDMIALLLENADHALALMRTIAFCYANFGLLISTKQNRLRFCEEILLKPAVFHKLFLSWSFTIRAYFLHLIVFRLGHVTDFPPPVDDPKNHTAVSIARLFSLRLDEIRKRHDELSPSDSQPSEPEEDEEAAKQRRQSFVSTIKRTPSIHQSEALSPVTTKAEKVLGIGMPDPMLLADKGAETKAQSRAAKWLRALGGMGTKAGNNGKRSGSGKGGKGRGEYGGAVSPSSGRSGSLTAMMEESSDDGSDDEGVAGRIMTPDLSSDAAMRGEMGSPVTGDHIATDAAFDLQSPTAGSPHPSTISSLRSTSPRVSRAFSKRSSLVPGPALDLVNDEDQPPVPLLPAHLRPVGYHQSQHVYAVQSLREYETTVQEHDDFMAQQPEGEKSAVPRLPVNWPAMWQGD